ncbi:serine/arginine-rich splicing factor 3-like isoform X4 [Haliotis rufescens]|uniref:serine/arginine-rich splicing factor 3-like isoform X4 n=1 Tax=Haliotis rufescens TaxID=6454 RepID=UPI00201EF990|nr:serine/arginine-rich splicing factor 3-like isoform X4 [Haliotis rufescens]
MIPLVSGDQFRCDKEGVLTPSDAADRKYYINIMARNATKDWRLDCKVYVGDLGYGAAKQELEEKFGKYGPLRNVWVARKPPGFAFVEFEDPRDAEDATRALDGARMNGRRVRVEMSSGKSRWGSRGPPVGRQGSSYDDYRPRRGRSRSPCLDVLCTCNLCVIDQYLSFSPRRRSHSPRRRSRSDSNSPRRRSRSR